MWRKRGGVSVEGEGRCECGGRGGEECECGGRGGGGV